MSFNDYRDNALRGVFDGSQFVAPGYSKIPGSAILDGSLAMRDMLGEGSMLVRIPNFAADRTNPAARGEYHVMSDVETARLFAPAVAKIPIQNMVVRDVHPNGIAGVQLVGHAKVVTSDISVKQANPGVPGQGAIEETKSPFGWVFWVALIGGFFVIQYAFSREVVAASTSPAGVNLDGLA